MEKEPVSKVTVVDDNVRIDLAEGMDSFTLIPLPMRYVDWIDRGRRAMYERILAGEGGGISFFPQHLPVVVTYSAGRRFPFNCGNKGVGFIPKEEYLSESIELLREVHARTRNRPWRESLTERVRAISKFYFARDRIDYRAMSTLEIFERTTFENLRKTPLASLLFTGHGPEYTSFQLNCVVETVGDNDPRHTFIELSRTMFEYDGFHISQPQFRYSYIFWISEVIDKTPFRVAEVKEAPAAAEREAGGSDMYWHAEAVQAVGRAPGLIQNYIRESVEKYARARGFEEITLEVLQEAKENLM